MTCSFCRTQYIVFAKSSEGIGPEIPTQDSIWPLLNLVTIPGSEVEGVPDPVAQAGEVQRQFRPVCSLGPFL